MGPFFSRLCFFRQGTTTGNVQGQCPEPKCTRLPSRGRPAFAEIFSQYQQILSGKVCKGLKKSTGRKTSTSLPTQIQDKKETCLHMFTIFSNRNAFYMASWFKKMPFSQRFFGKPHGSNSVALLCDLVEVQHGRAKAEASRKVGDWTTTERLDE